VSESGKRFLIAAACVGALLVSVALALRLSGRPPEAAVEPVWDRTACARCRMLLSDPDYASQLHLRDGRVLHFDDPGCLLAYLTEEGPEVHRAWFHAAGGAGWIAGDEVAFERVEPSRTPMGYGLAAARRGTPATLEFERAIALIDKIERSRRDRSGVEGP